LLLPSQDHNLLFPFVTFYIVKAEIIYPKKIYPKKDNKKSCMFGLLVVRPLWVLSLDHACKLPCKFEMAPVMSNIYL
jgi:hypothetical protein